MSNFQGFHTFNTFPNHPSNYLQTETDLDRYYKTESQNAKMLLRGTPLVDAVPLVPLAPVPDRKIRRKRTHVNTTTRNLFPNCSLERTNVGIVKSEPEPEQQPSTQPSTPEPGTPEPEAPEFLFNIDDSEISDLTKPRFQPYIIKRKKDDKKKIRTLKKQVEEFRSSWIKSFKGHAEYRTEANAEIEQLNIQLHHAREEDAKLHKMIQVLKDEKAKLEEDLNETKATLDFVFNPTSH